MSENNWEYYANHILNVLVRIHPNLSTGRVLTRENYKDSWQDDASKITYAFNFLLEEGLIIQTQPGTYQCTNKGLSLSGKDIVQYVQVKKKAESLELEQKQLNLTKLREDVRKIKREKIWWWIAAALGVAGFVMQILKIL